ncbi:MAG: amino acid transporter [Cyanobacteria bacterium REEB67]|nr:amino acid transporter [Cyanobacteria bacterium REEB67]
MDDELTIKHPASEGTHHQGPWWKVMCLTGVDYFSTLGYQPGIAFLAAGVLSPIATAILVLLTLVGALPVYHQVARSSPYGQGSLAMLEELLPKWKGKTLVLCLLGFAATDFIITITLSAADAAAHIVNNEMLNHILPFGQIWLTLMLVLILGGIFLLGFKEAIGVSFALVTLYLGLNVVVVGKAIIVLFEHPEYFSNWTNALYTEHHSIAKMIGVSCLLFPKLALGLSGFETGVAVMPLVQGDESDTLIRPRGRIRKTQHLLTVAALIMSVFLIGSAMTTTLIIPKKEFLEGGLANGRALSYLCHHLLGHELGTVYDLSSILILWFAGASAMAGLLNLVPRYLPRYGMAPEWARAMRPLVIFLTAVALAVTIIFKANVDAQGGAYATGVLVLITSAALAVTLKFWKRPWRRLMFALITLIFAYTTVVNVYERPDGLHIACFFISAILLTSLVSRAMRSTELRVLKVELDATCREFIHEDDSGQIRIVAHRPGGTDYDQKELEACETHNLVPDHLIFLEVSLGDASEFNSETLKVEGERVGRYRVMRCTSPAIPNAIAAILLNIRDQTGKHPHVYLGWTEGNPVLYVIKFIFLGEGETAPVTREILREVESDPKKRPRVHVG